MLLKERYFLVVLGSSFEKNTVEYDRHPTKEEIVEEIKSVNGESARVEKRYVLTSKERVSN